ncbi:hypothetical protein ACN27J_29370 [Solwaraspora sp. WMMB762]|uniref:hypothetical protein n=1 Tax=Solwaraspora sp. WMMB762 TaxID=3404120 RepID=UPI003B9339FD
MVGVGIWGLLIASCLVLLALLALAALAARTAEHPADRRALRAEADELAAEAQTIAVAADNARTAADQLRDRAAAAELARDDAWQRQETAGRAYQQALLADQEDRPAAVVTGAPLPAEHGRDVSRAALTAYRRGDISVQQLRTVWRRAGGAPPDPTAADRADRAVDRHRVRDQAARREYDVVAAAARRAVEAAYIAELSAAALAEEAAAAAADAEEARYVADRAERSH